jgi:predicted component of type VI protein secretion system
MSGSAQIGIPIGQVTYQSFISLQEEYLPINVDIVAAPGCDRMLLELVKHLTELAVAKTVKVGKTAF